MLHQAEARVHPVTLWTPSLPSILVPEPGWIMGGATGTALSDYLENKLLDHTLSATVFTSPTAINTALYTAAPSDTGGGTEVTGGSYARVSKTANTTSFPAASGGSKSNGVSIDFPTATAAWGTVTHVGVFDQTTNLLFWGALTASRVVQNGDTISFAVTKLVFSLD